MYLLRLLIVFSLPVFAGEKILMVTAEQSGIFNTGGLGHTTAGLSSALQQAGHQVDVLMPYYSNLSQEIKDKATYEGMEYHVPWQSGAPLRFQIYSVINPKNGVKTYLVKCVAPADLFENQKLNGQPIKYTNRPNEEQAFAMFSKVAAGFVHRRNYTIVNSHDWHAGFVGYYIKNDVLLDVNPNPDLRVMFTISNLGYQGLVDPGVLGTEAPTSSEFTPDKYEFHGKYNMMKAGILDSDAVLTVSENYLANIKTPRFGHGLDGFLKHVEKFKPVVAIRNGADVSSWIPKNFSAANFSGKTQGKLKLQNQLGLPVGEDKALFVFTSRLAHQKGYDYLPGAIENFLNAQPDAQVAIMGDGDKKYVDAIKDLQTKYPKQVVYKEFSAELEYPMTQYADFFVNTPWYEPSGTNQIFAMAAGTPPIVTDVGGLPNYVSDGKTGIVAKMHFVPDSSEVLVTETQKSITQAFERAFKLFQDKDAYFKVAAAAMNQDNSWHARTDAYTQLFLDLKKKPSQLLNLQNAKAFCNRAFLNLLPFIRKVEIHSEKFR